MFERDRILVLISGLPGAGKTTLAVPLAERLRLPLLAKDYFKETILDGLEEPPPNLERSRVLGRTAMKLMFETARHCPRVVLEANFRPQSDIEREHLLALGGSIVEVHCRCPTEVALRRYRERGPRRHAVHPLWEMSPEMAAEFDGPMRLGPVLEVDTTTDVDIEALAARVTSALPG